jgi:phosphoribosylanthranilate isomerase
MYRISVADYTYIGNTRDFKQRKQNHKNACNNVNNPSHNLKVYKIIRENGGWDKSEMIPIEECECENTIQVHIREEELRKEYNAEMNSFKAYRTIEEKKEYDREKSKKKYEANKEIILQENKNKYNCECGTMFSINNKSNHLKTKKHQDYINSLVVVATP